MLPNQQNVNKKRKSETSASGPQQPLKRQKTNNDAPLISTASIKSYFKSNRNPKTANRCSINCIYVQLLIQ